MAESTVTYLKEKALQANIEVEVRPALSFLDALYPLINKDPTQGLQIYDAVHNQVEKLNPYVDAIICQVYNRFVAGDVKLSLMEQYPDEHKIKVIRAAGVPKLEKIVEIPLYQLDHLKWIDHLTSIYVPALAVGGNACQYPLDPLVDVLERLLAPDGCPWDRQQNHFTLKRYLLEESYEVIEAIDNNDMNNLCEELGDLLLQIVFHANLAAQRNDFSINDVIAQVTEKMIRRHPHVFADTNVANAQEVLINWENIKAQEKGRIKNKSLLGNVPKSFPALLHAIKIQEKASEVGFDWSDISGAWDKLLEELRELQEAVLNDKNFYEELGDVLFSVVNVARFLRVNPEEALLATIRKFRARFAYLEKRIQASGKSSKDLDLEQLDKWWEESKN